MDNDGHVGSLYRTDSKTEALLCNTREVSKSSRVALHTKIGQFMDQIKAEKGELLAIANRAKTLKAESSSLC